MNLKDIISNSGQSLSQRAVKGSFWVFSTRITQQALHIVRLVILARILLPNDFGLVGIALLTLSILETFSRPGFQQALVQKTENVESYLNSAWTVLILRGFVIFIILYLSSPYVAAFFDAPQSKQIIQVIGFSIVLNAFTNIGIVYFQKELEFNKQFAYELTGTFADFFVAVSAALIMRSVWAIVYGIVAANIVKCITSYFLHPFRPRLSFDFAKARELWGFGRWVLGSSALVFLVTHGDDILVGKLLGSIALGFYQLAYRISNMPATEITHVISQVTFPVYSKLQNNLGKLGEAYLKTLQMTSLLAFPVAGFIFLFIADFTRIFLGAKWMPMVPAAQVLVFAGLLRSIAATAGYVLYAVGKPRIDTVLQAVRLLILAVFLYPLTAKWGILGASVAVFTSIFVSGVGFGVFAIRITKCGTKSFIKALLFPLLNVSLSILLMSAVDASGSDGIGYFILSVIMGICVYLTLTYLSEKFFNYGITPLIQESMKALRAR